MRKSPPVCLPGPRGSARERRYDLDFLRCVTLLETCFVVIDLLLVHIVPEGSLKDGEGERKTLGKDVMV